MKLLSRAFLTILTSFSLVDLANAEVVTQTKSKNSFPVKYRSEDDEKIVLKTLTLAPAYDNVNGIYAKPIEKLLSELLQNDKAWGYSVFPEMKAKFFVEELESKPQLVLEILKKSTAQGLLTTIITKGPNGLNAKLQLFTHDKGLLLAEEEYSDPNVFEIKTLRERIAKMYHSLKNKLPYRGFILSRRGLDVTINMGSYNGIKNDHELIAAQIIKLKRHPKLTYMVGVEKEIIGKIKITKVEPYLSFGTIIFEKESGVLEVGAKILPSTFLAYPTPRLNSDGSVKEEMIADGIASPSEVPDVQSPAPLVHLENEWEPFYDREDSFGFFTAQLVVGQFSETDSLRAGGSNTSSNGFAPGVNLATQYYFYKDSYLRLSALQSLFSVNNPSSGSNPRDISFSYSQYQLAFGYDLYLHGFMRGLRITPALIYTTTNTKPSTSTPTAFVGTNTDAVGFQIGTGIPLAKGFLLSEAGMNIDINFSPKIRESSVNSGDSKASLNAIGFYTILPYSENLRFRADLTLTNMSANFSGKTNRSPSVSSTTFQMISEQAGIEYLF